MEKLPTCFWIYLHILTFGQRSQQDDPASLHNSLMEGYNRRMRPGILTPIPVKVNLRPHVNTINDINMKDQTVEAELSVRLIWTDRRLSWNQSSFENISWITIETEKIWTPDLVLSGQNASRYFVDASKFLAKVRSNGLVDLWFFIKEELVIDIAVAKYPFDEQVIEFEFESWTLTKDDMVFTINANFNPIGSLKQNGQWYLIGFEMIDTSNTYSDGEAYHRGGCRIFSKRRVLYHIVNIIGPVLLISLLNILCFVLPTSSGERVSLSMTIFLTLAVILSVINESLPMSSLGVPIIVVYVGLQMVGSAFTIAMTVLLIWYSKKDSAQDLPKFIKCIISPQCCNGNRTKRHEHDASSQVGLHKLRKSANSHDDENDVIDKHPEEWSRDDGPLTREAISSWVNSVCFWLAILWNVALLAIMLIYVGV